ncbi:hypothetical protein BS47DRAFT_1335518 [Hydnum rufescens UP504]|uniref:Uncharacterized protein n=1 Tax=Hydnum rufescens UP504 TaxID=1448309 RepID=A0A9P6BAP5_9AGAM|nr:hypothetical protein BS47DRAFT_1335518 [Hydnum rufescens UP504]
MPSKPKRIRTLPPQPRNSRIIYQDDLRWDPKVNALWKSTLPGQRLPVDRALGAEPEEVVAAYKRLQREERVAHAKFWKAKEADYRPVDEHSLREWRKIQIEEFTMRGRSPEPRFYKGPPKRQKEAALPSREPGSSKDRTKAMEAQVESNATISHSKSRLPTTKDLGSPRLASSSKLSRSRRDGLHQDDSDQIPRHMHPYRSGGRPAPISPAGRARIPAYPLRLRATMLVIPNRTICNGILAPRLTPSLDLFAPFLDLESSVLDISIFGANNRASTTLDSSNDDPASPFRYQDPEVYDKERETDKGIMSVDFSRAGLEEMWTSNVSL